MKNEHLFNAVVRPLGAARTAVFLCVVVACVNSNSSPPVNGGPIPLVRVADVELPGGATRFDYQDIDEAEQHLVIAHMGSDSVVVADLRDGHSVKELKGIPTPRGIAIAPEVGRIFVTSSPHELVIVDSKALVELGRVQTGDRPDGVAWDPQHNMVGVSDQGDGALSLIADAGNGERRQVSLGNETGNVVFDAKRGLFWITVVPKSGSDQLIAVDPSSAQVDTTLALPGCRGAHGLRLHPDGQKAPSWRANRTTCWRASCSMEATPLVPGRQVRARTCSRSTPTTDGYTSLRRAVT